MARGGNPQVARHLKWFSPYLNDGENLLDGGPAISDELERRYGRGAKDGTIGVTTHRILFVGMNGALMISEPRSQLVSAKKEWIVIPGSSWLRLNFRGDQSLSFITGNAVLKSLLPILSGR